MKIDIDIPDSKSGNWKIESFIVTENDLFIFNLRASFQPRNRKMYAGSYKKLTKNGQIIMSNTHAEIQDHLPFIFIAKKGGHILINGLGLGVVLKAILKSNKIKSVTVIEKSKDVINLVAKYYEKDKRVTIIHADAFEYKPPKGQRYNAVWHDIWGTICSDNLPEMTKLHRKYSKKTDWQDSWCKQLCKIQRNY